MQKRNPVEILTRHDCAVKRDKPMTITTTTTTKSQTDHGDEEDAGVFIYGHDRDEDLASNEPISPNVNHWNYFSIIEVVVVSIGFLLAWYLPSKLGVPQLNVRPIPFQILENGEYVRNLAYNEPIVSETVSWDLCLFLSCKLPLVLQLCIARFYFKQASDAYGTICVYLVAMGITQIVSRGLKQYVGYLRPHFYASCIPNDTYEKCTTGTEGAFKSFPSSHASISFCGLTLLTLYLHDRFGVPSIRILKAVTDTDTGEVHWINTYKRNPIPYRIISILSLLPMGLAFFISASRINENAHFPADVIAGSILGSSIAVYIHGLWM